MNTPADPYRDWDVAYVLGSLSPAERRELERHLAECPTCAGNVGELAGMPGILASLSPERALELLDPAGPPPQAPPRRLSRLSRRRERARFAAALAGAAAAGAALALAAARASRGNQARRR
ncbi:zf-HC2 domain-containing protein [Amycolatopsis sp. NPDC051128]|uniref:anti-sigma factor family protein n=1 Tax=Amycolatopsis sp. NPDC051128 TaxID=3155412 RepID=UPI003436F50E